MPEEVIPPQWGEEPSADPQVKRDYQAALGAFLVAFNEIDDSADRLIELALRQAGKSDLAQEVEFSSLTARIDALALLGVVGNEIVGPALRTEIRQLNVERNRLAHGHFDQNPFDGSYGVLQKRGRVRRLGYPVSSIVLSQRRAEAVSVVLRQAEAPFWFETPED